MTNPHAALKPALAAFIPRDRLIDDPLRLLAWGTDASFYRLIPKLVVVVDKPTAKTYVKLNSLLSRANGRMRS